MSTPRAAWGIEIGANAIKAIRLEREGDDVRVSDFSVIHHTKVLTTPDLDQDEMIRLSLGQFISQKSLEGEHLVMSVPGHAAFARFAKLPPVEPKKVPDIVKFEAVQQIPFPIDEVEWDYQTFTSDDSPEVEVGIFAITRERVQQRLGLYAELGLGAEALTLSPVAVYNAMAYDYALDDASGPVIFLDIGTQATDVVIAEGGRCWIRTFPLGGTHFTEAIASAFKLSYSKAEKLKKEASTSKYAKQIMQAMRPVFSDLLADLQRSIGYYQSLHRERELTTMVGIGSTFKIPGLRKFIGQQLQINVNRLDEYRRISVTGREAASFGENAVNMASAYGLALQGVGLAPISVNLVPVKALREQMWHAKTKWFAAAAAIIVAGAATTLYHPLTARSQLQPGPGPSEASQAVSVGSRYRSEYQTISGSAGVGFTAENMRRLVDDRHVWPFLLHDVSAALASTDPQPVLLGDDIEAMRELDPKERRLVQLHALDGKYEYDPQGKRRLIHVTATVDLSHERPDVFLRDHVVAWLRDHAEPSGERADVPYRILAETVSLNPTKRETVTVGDDGVAVFTGSPGAGRPGGGSRGGSGSPPGRRPPSADPDRAPPGPTGGGPGFGSTGAGAPGRRTPGKQRTVPGTAGAGLGTAGAGPAGFGTPGQPADPFGTGSSGGLPDPASPQQPRHADLDKDAPVPSRPSPFPSGSERHRFPVTFTVEIVEEGATMPADGAAKANPDATESNS